MKAYHNKPELKQMMVEEAIKHRKADSLLQNFGYGKTEGDQFKGCAVGCTLHSLEVKLGKEIIYNDHSAYERELGIPQILARLEDGIFERLPKKEAMTWPQRFLEAAPVGADLSKVGDKFLHWLLVDPQDGVIKFAKTDRTKKAIQDVADLYAKKIAGESVTREQWIAARQAASAAAYADDAAVPAADAAADTAAYTAAAAYAADAADADAAAAYAFAADAAYAAAAAAYAARKAARVKQSEKLLELMAAAPIEQEVAAK